MAWSRNNLAHVYTHAALVSLKQYRARPFPQVAKIKVKDMDFFPGVRASENTRKLAARALASMIDGVMNQWIEDAKYEKGFGATRTINKLTKVLSEGDSSVEDVGEAVDECFFFLGEIHDG